MTGTGRRHDAGRRGSTFSRGSPELHPRRFPTPSVCGIRSERRRRIAILPHAVRAVDAGHLVRSRRVRRDPAELRPCTVACLGTPCPAIVPGDARLVHAAFRRFGIRHTTRSQVDGVIRRNLRRLHARTGDSRPCRTAAQLLPHPGPRRTAIVGVQQHRRRAQTGRCRAGDTRKPSGFRSPRPYRPCRTE